MGADGGIHWVRYRDPDKRQRVYELIAPLGLIENNLRDEDSKYLSENPIDWRLNLITRYGTDLFHNGLKELRDILSNLEEHPIDITFEDILIDLATCPDWEMFQQFSPLKLALLRSCGGLVWNDYFNKPRRINSEIRFTQILKGMEYIQDIKHMKVQDWADEIKSILHWKNIAVAETWT